MDPFRELIGGLKQEWAAQRLGKYVLRREVARGGMGIVYEAEDPALKRRVAIKVLRSDRNRPQLVERLHREASIAARLSHPNIVGVHEVGVVDGVHFIAMDFIEGRANACACWRWWRGPSRTRTRAAWSTGI
jgi:serine/threonine protein kinase